MKKGLKKFLTLFLVFSLSFGLTATAIAAEENLWISESEREALCEALYGVEMQKNRLGLTDIDFANLRIGAPVQTYLYVDNVFEPAQEMYPVLGNDKLILWAIQSGDGFQITDALVEEVNNSIEMDEPFSIVYDRKNSYLYADNTFTFLGTFAMEEESRSVLDADAVEISSEMETTSLSENTILGYSKGNARAPIYYECSVEFVTQNPASKMCWAATTACIANYINGTSLTAVQVAQNYYGSDYDHGVSYQDAPIVLGAYGLNYTYQEVVPSANLLLEQIQADYPVYTSWMSGDISHAVCVYGVAPISGYIYIMDPEYGFTSAGNSTGQYTFVSGYNGNVYTLYRAVYHKS